MSNCVTNCPAPKECQCSASQTCVLIGRSCDSCGENVCQDNIGSGRKGSSPGATAGEAIGGMLAGLVVAYLVYRFWFKQKLREHRMAASQRVRFGGDTKTDSAPAPRRKSRMVSRQIGQEEQMIMADDIAAARKRNTLLSPTTPEIEISPFSDDQAMDPQERTSAQPSDFSFRSPTSSSSIPAAYIPPHANSMSLEDGMERGSLGESKRKSLLPLPNKRATLVPDGTHLEVLQPSLKSSPSIRSDKSGPKPSRPQREGLDLKLPKMAAGASQAGFGLSSGSSADARPLSTFPFGTEPPATGSADSRFSASSEDSRASSMLAIPGQAPRNSTSSVDTNHLSVMSHMSYLMDPPKIMTANHTARVEVVGTAQAHTIHLNNSATPTQNPNTPITPSPQETLDVRQSTDDPFADQVSNVIGGFGYNQPLTTPTFGASQTFFNDQHLPYERSSVASSLPGDFSSELGNATRASVATDDMSIFTGSSRPNTTMRHYSGASSNRDSILDAMPFVALPAQRPSTDAPVLTPSSPYFPTPPPRSPALDPDRASNPFSDPGAAEFSDAATHGDDSPRSMHFNRPDDRYSQVSRTSTAGASVRSGYGSVLENIPFQLGFSGSPSNRGSLWSDGSDNRLSRPYSEAGSLAGGRYSTATTEPVPPVPALPRSSLAAPPLSPGGGQDASVPDAFLSDEEKLQTPKMEQGETMTGLPETPDLGGTPKSLRDATPRAAKSGADVRASTDSFMQDAALYAQFGEGT